MNLSKIISSYALTAILLAGVPTASADNTSSVPLEFSHHGIIWDGDELFKGTTNLKVAVFNTTNDNPIEIASTTKNNLEINDGYYSVTIKEIDPAKLLEAKGNLKVQITVGDKVMPMIPVSSVPYAIAANYADKADVANYVACEGCISKENLDDVMVGIIENASEKEIADKSVTLEKLAGDIKFALSDTAGGSALEAQHAANADKATSDANGKNIADTYATKNDLTGYVSTTGTAARATADASGKNIESTYQKKSDSINGSNISNGTVSLNKLEYGGVGAVFNGRFYCSAANACVASGGKYVSYCSQLGLNPYLSKNIESIEPVVNEDGSWAKGSYKVTFKQALPTHTYVATFDQSWGWQWWVRSTGDKEKNGFTFMIAKGYVDSNNNLKYSNEDNLKISVEESTMDACTTKRNSMLNISDNYLSIRFAIFD